MQEPTLPAKGLAALDLPATNRAASGIPTRARHVTPEQRHNVRALLSESFVDSWVDYAWIARELEPFDLAELKRIFYEEVAPVCYYNIVAPVPPVWTGFEPVSLNEEIEELLEARRRNPLRRHWDRLWAATWIRLWSQECWDAIHQACLAQRQA